MPTAARKLARSPASLPPARIAGVWTSDLARARETGAIVATELGLAAPRVDAELRERRFGVFEGLTRDECATRYPDAWRAWTSRTEHPPGGESREDATARMVRAIDRVRAEARADAAALIVTHGGVMRLWLANVTGETVPLVGNGAVYTVEYDGAAFRCALRARA
jgi:broad specificity phosphatase PhoE